MELLAPDPSCSAPLCTCLPNPPRWAAQDQPLPGGSGRCRARCHHRSPLLLPCSDTGGVLAQQGTGPARVPVATSPQATKPASKGGVGEKLRLSKTTQPTASQPLSEQMCQLEFSADKSRSDGCTGNNLNCTETLMSCEN